MLLFFSFLHTRKLLNVGDADDHLIEAIDEMCVLVGTS
jgi:hypothetical protein